MRPTQKVKEGSLYRNSSSQSNLVAGEGDAATDGLEPCNAVEFGEDGLDLPCIRLTLGVGCLQVGDTVDRVGCRESGIPSESDVLAVEGINGDNAQWDRRLSTLALFEGSLAGEDWSASGGETLEGEDGVGIVDEVICQDFVGLGLRVGNDEVFEAIGKVGCGVRSQALGRVMMSTPETTRAPRSSVGRGDEGGGGDSSE